FPDARVRPHLDAGRRGLHRDRRGDRSGRSARLDRQGSVSAEAPARPRQVEAHRRRRVRVRLDRRLPGRARRDGLQLSRRHDGNRRRRAHRDALRAGRAAASSGRRRDRQRRGAHGRGDARAHADGEDDARRAAVPRRRRLLRERAHRSDDRRRHRVVRLRSGRHRRRGARSDRLRRTPRHRADDPPAAAGQLPDRRVLAGEGRDRHGGRAQRTEGHAGAAARLRLGGASVGERPRVGRRGGGGAMNTIVEREKGLLELEQRITELKAHAAQQPVDMSAEIRALESKYAQIQREIFGTMTAWQRVNMARHPKRPLGSDYIAALDRFDELHGDRHFRDDRAIVGGFAKLRGRRIVAIAQDKGRDTKDKVLRNFGMPSPEGYRKVIRLVQLAERVNLPVVTFVDTSGADPGIGSEERAQGEAIAQSLYQLAGTRVPIVATVIGEGGSGGALALALGDRVLMLEHSVYSVASPEGAAAILWGDAARAEEAATRLKLTADDLLGFGIIDEIVPEPLGGAHRDPESTIARVLDAVDAALTAQDALDVDERLERRYRKFRRIGSV